MHAERIVCISICIIPRSRSSGACLGCAPAPGFLLCSSRPAEHMYVSAQGERVRTPRSFRGGRSVLRDRHRVRQGRPCSIGSRCGCCAGGGWRLGCKGWLCLKGHWVFCGLRWSLLLYAQRLVIICKYGWDMSEAGCAGEQRLLEGMHGGMS